MPQLDLTFTPVMSAAPAGSMKIKQPPKAQDTPYEGVQYVATNGLVFTPANYTVKSLIEFSKSYYGSKLCLHLLTLLFPGDLKIKVIDETGTEDPELSQEMKVMADTVNLWTQIKNTFVDACWGGLYVSNPVWAWEENRYNLIDLVRLPWDSFELSAPSALYNYSELLPGITLAPDGKTVEYWQTVNGIQTQLKSIFTVKAPLSTQLAGEPIFRPLLDTLCYAKFAWESVIQTLHRIGAPVLFIRVSNGTADDVAYANAILKNWGKNTAFQLRENMELIDPKITEPTTSMEAINTLAQMVVDFFSPAGFVQNNNATLSSSDTGSNRMMQAFISGIHSWLEDAYEGLLQTKIDAEGYVGYRVVIDLPTFEPDRTDENRLIAESGFKVEALDLDERRALLGQEPADEEKAARIREEYAARQSGGNPGSFVTSAMRFYANAAPFDSKKKLRN